MSTVVQRTEDICSRFASEMFWITDRKATIPPPLTGAIENPVSVTNSEHSHWGVVNDSEIREMAGPIRLLIKRARDQEAASRNRDTIRA
jgi:hypothetical protein